MRILFTIAHFFDPKGSGKYGSTSPDPHARVNALNSCIIALKQLFDKQYMIDIARRQTIPANQVHEFEADIVICTTKDFHLLEHLPFPTNKYAHQPTDAEPILLGFECQSVLRDNLGKYDYYCYLEDDLILHDPLFFTKLDWFNAQTGDLCLLQPNRYEVSSHGPIYKAYNDGNINLRATAQFQNISEQTQITGNIMGKPIVFKRPSNPHSGCYFLNAKQMEYWTKQTYFLDHDTSFIGPLESAATLGIMRSFKIYKPASHNANFLEIQHYGKAFLNHIGKQIAFVDEINNKSKNI